MDIQCTIDRSSPKDQRASRTRNSAGIEPFRSLGSSSSSPPGYGVRTSGDRRAAARGGWRSTSQARSARRGAERRLFSPSRWKEARSGGPADDPSRMAGRGWGAGGRWIRSFSGCALPGRRTVSMARCLSLGSRWAGALPRWAWVDLGLNIIWY